MSEEDRIKFDGLIDALGPNEFLGNYTFPLTTESGEKKFIQGLITVDGCSFVNCSATDEDGSHGGAICSVDGLITVDGCSFVNCSADFGG